MRTLTEYINEHLIIEGATIHLFKLNASNAQKGIKIEDSLKSFLTNSKTRYSFNNKQDLAQFFKAFCDYGKVDRSVLKEFNITDGASIAKLIIAKKDALEEAGWNFNCIKSFDETEMQKEYKAWKKSDDYVEGRHIDKDDYKNADEASLVRTLVVYDVNDPGNEDTTLEYDFEGVRSKDNMHQVHMIRMDWHYQTGLKYYDAREILLSNYLKKTAGELEKVDVFNDIIGKND